MKKLHVTSLGCPKNLVDTEVMLGLLEKNGWQIVGEPEQADILLVNTCGFIQPAVEEGIDAILEIAEYKKDSKKFLVVTGCMVQRYGKSLQQEIPEIDLLVGTEGIAEIAALLNNLVVSQEKIVEPYMPSPFLMDWQLPRRRVTPPHRAWMKITEGCDNHCAYCMIPSLRGKLRSRQEQDLLAEAQYLEKQGVKELALIAQDLTAYGVDLSGASSLLPLIQTLLKHTSLPWLRLLYLYPSGVTDDLLHLMAEESRITPYLDIPFQHVSSSVLRRMNRRYDKEDVYALLERCRRIVPGIALRTTFLVGFPGETEQDIEDLADFIRFAKLDHVGVFAYANEEGCPSENFPEQIEEEEKERRRAHIMALQADISQKIQESYVGRIEQVLVEGVSSETDLLLEGRTRYQAPEIDGCVYINDGVADVGDIVDVRITESQIYDLVGAIVSDDEKNGN